MYVRLVFHVCTQVVSQERSSVMMNVVVEGV